MRATQLCPPLERIASSRSWHPLCKAGGRASLRDTVAPRLTLFELPQTAALSGMGLLSALLGLQPCQLEDRGRCGGLACAALWRCRLFCEKCRSLLMPA